MHSSHQLIKHITQARIVVEDVPDYAIACDNPAKIVQVRFDKENIYRLLDLDWWDWGIEKINFELPPICSLNIEALGDD